MLHAGGKFGGGGYKVSGGLHGVGVSVVNALSSTARRRDPPRRPCLDPVLRRRRPAGPAAQGRPTDRTGTTITFWASPDIFETTDYSFETLSNRLREMAFLNSGLTIVLRDERPASAEEKEHDEVDETTQTEVTYRYDGGLVDYVNFLGARKDPVHRTVVSFEAESEYIDGGLSLDVAMQWNTGFTESVHTFANTINTHEGGTHEEGFRAALTTLVNKFARDWNILKEKDANLTGDDVREGLTAIVSVKLAEPQFEGQTKTKLGNTEAKSFVQKVVNDQLGEWFEKNPSEGKDIARKAQGAAVGPDGGPQGPRRRAQPQGSARRRQPAGQARRLPVDQPRGVRALHRRGRLGRRPGQAGPRPADPGDPADPRQDPQRRAGPASTASCGNQEVQAIISALGTGIQGDEFDLARLRYHKVVLMADADVDGQHIRTLLLTLLFRFMPEVVEQGHVFLAQPPLYKLKWARPAEPEYAYSDRERDALIEAGIAAGKKLLKDDGVQRYKGLGEMNNDELWDTTMDPAKRILLQVTLENAALADVLFTELMGEDVESRRKFIQRNAKDVRFLDI